MLHVSSILRKIVHGFHAKSILPRNYGADNMGEEEDMRVANAIPARAPWRPVPHRPRMGQGVVDEFRRVAPEFELPFKFLAVGGGWVVGDIVGHQLFEETAGERTPTFYYRNKLLLSLPMLLAGRILSDVVGGPPLARAAVIATTANSLAQVRYLTGGFSAEFNLIVFALHEALLLPLSLLIVGEPGEVLFFREAKAGY